MGVCGCGEIRPIKNIKVGEDRYITVSYYPGCQECGGVIGMELYLFNKKGLKEYCNNKLPKMPVVKFDEYGGDIVALPLMDVDDFLKLSEDDVPFTIDSFDDYETVGDWLAGNGLGLIQKAIYKTIEENKNYK